MNSTILANMSFAKTSQKFGQWSDPRVGTVYGLGFNSEMELTKVSLQIHFSSNFAFILRCLFKTKMFSDDSVL